MNEQQWTFPERIDRRTWTNGPWTNEPDKVEWRDETTGLPCIAHRNHFGAWCGYVAVSEGHPLYQVGYYDCPQGCEESWCEHQPGSLLDVHGGITYAAPCREADLPFGVCHIPQEGEADTVWWFGFDCAHCDDVTPSTVRYFAPRPTDVYRTLDYVQRECHKLAAQLAHVARGEN